ncbi:hypothetical protein PybrP1_000047 [[Pythium] brassicae (nom. inval.)]|nr:hypothetical protein PybrP1_000047 [[Pythium] brassicae (nom. inval.)]
MATSELSLPPSPPHSFPSSLPLTPVRVPHRRAATSSCRSVAPMDDAALRRSLRIDEFSRAAHSGVWYYQVDIAVFSADLDEGPDSSVNSSDDDDAADADDDTASTLRCSIAGTEPDVQYYSVLRRYNDFLHLHESVRAHLDALGVSDPLPPFPVKELISPSVFGPLWRLKSSVDVLHERRAKFEALLQFIEQHELARRCPAFTDFVGRPPQRQDGGYVSLKEYTSQNWLSSLKQLTRAKEEQRTRHYTMDTDSLVQLCEPTPKPSQVHKSAVQALLGKRRRRPRPSSNSSSGAGTGGGSVGSFVVQVSEADAAPPQLQLQLQLQMEQTIPISQRQDAAQVGGARPFSKKPKSFHHESLDGDAIEA